MNKNKGEKEKTPPAASQQKAKKKPPTMATQKKQWEEQIKNEKEKFVRLFAEFENYKKRTAKERLELFDTANKEVINSLLPILDDFDRALNQEKKEKHNEGFLLIYTKLKNILFEKGLSLLEIKKGEIFDTEKHEAITQLAVKNKKQVGKIVDIVEKGYLLGDKIIRYPKVVVGK